MSYQLYPSDLTDREWEYIKCLIPAAKSGGRKRQTDMRLTVNAIFYINRAGWGVAIPAPRVSALADRLWLLPRLANRRHLGANPRSLTRPSPRAGGTPAAADRGHSRQPDGQDHGSWRPQARV